MPLSPQQTRIASMLYNLARSRGLPHNRAVEFASAAYAESGLDPKIYNRQGSGAAGLFQLLSSGYVNTANKLGGVLNPRANALAILPSYIDYWKKHPRAAPGEGGRDVEISGQGASFYANPIKLLAAALGGGTGPAPAPLNPRSGPQAPGFTEIGGLPALRNMSPELRQLALSRLTEHGPLARLQSNPDLLNMALAQLLPQRVQAQNVLAKAGQDGALPAEPTPTKPGQVEGSLLDLAVKYGLKITSGYRSVAEQAKLYANRSGPGSVAAPGKSYHNSGRAIDVAPDANALRLYRYALKHPGMFAEAFFDPMGVYIKNGKVYKGAIGGHSDHVHFAI